MKLDCHTRDSTLLSVSRHYGVGVEQVRDFLLGVDLEAYCEEHHPEGRYDVVLGRLLEREFGPVQQELSAVSWFHLTRVLPDEDFSGGILPLDKALDGVWSTLERIFDGSPHVDNLRVLRREGVPNWLYNFKLEDGMDKGPFAMLVREAAFRPEEQANHDYHTIPEIVRDLCDGYQKRFGLPIEGEVQAALRPRIVKFASTLRLDRACIEAATLYLYGALRGLPPSWLSNAYYSGAGLAVPHCAIEQVEFVGSAG